MGDVRDVEIARVGAQGDGLVIGGDGPLYVPFTLAGERVRIEVTGAVAKMIEILEPSQDRISPICQHFGRCGGCALQHMAPPAYLSWKHDQVVAAFKARGFDVTIDAVIPARGLRRRATFSAHHDQHRVRLGFHASGTHDLIDIIECPVLDSGIVAALPAIRRMIDPLMPKRENVRISATMMTSGIDVAVEGIRRTLTADVRTRLARDAAELHLARVSVDGDTVYEVLTASLEFGSAEVVIPAQIFIQAVREAEQDMAAIILAAVGKAKRVVDLFSGVGAFTFPLGRAAKVTAFDSDARAIGALNAAVKRASGLKPISAHVRDLFREPLSAVELNDFDAIVFDPPRAGAEAQSRMIAKSKVKTVVAVSCNPATLARDARILVDGGYTMTDVTPIDQFRYSPHIEAVGVFRREKPERL